MQIFYHGTRDIELPTPVRRAPRAAVSRQCEACGKRLSEQDVSETGGQQLAFCEECRRRLDRSAIQIHFCDACGVSVPLDAVQEGTALSPDGRILCLACRAPRLPRPAATFPWAVALAGLALLAGALAAWLAR